MTLSTVKAKIAVKQVKEDCFGSSCNKLECNTEHNSSNLKKKKKTGEYLRVEFEDS